MTNFLIKKVAYGNGIFIATTGDKILKSADGKTWSEIGLNNSNNVESLSNVVFADGKFLVCGGTYFYISSDNGRTWNEDICSYAITDATSGNGSFILVSPTGGCIKIDTTTLEKTLFTQNLKAVTYFKGTFYGVLNDTDNDDGLYRLDGENWTKIYNSIHPGDVCLRGIKNDLYMTVLGMTFIFVWDENGNVTDFTYANDYPDAMVDGMEVNGTIYILTNYCLCEDTSPVRTSNSEDYKCICIDETNTIYIFSSSNVITYNVRPVINSITYGNGVYMAVADEQVLKSIDGENWEIVKTLELENNSGLIEFGDNIFVVCAGGNYFITRNNGTTWSKKTYSGNIASICFGDNKFYIAGTAETISIDSATLEVSTVNTYSGFSSIEYLDGKLYGITAIGAKIWVLNDSQWVELYSSDDVIDIEYRYLTGCNNCLFLGTSNATYEVARDPGNSYYNLISLQTSGKLIGSCALNGRCYLLTEMGLYEDEVLVETFGTGSFTAFCANSNSSVFLVAQSINRAAFSEYISTKPDFNIQDVAYSDGVYIAAAGDRILRSTDGNNWETVQLTNKTNTDNQLNKVIFGNGKFVVGGSMFYYISEDNGINWSENGAALSLKNIAYGNDKFMLCNDEFDYNLIIDSNTMNFNWISTGNYMNDIAFANNAFYGIKYSANGSELYKYDFSGNCWIPFVTGLALAENPKLFSTGDRLFLGNNGVTYEFTQNTADEFSAMTVCAYIDGEVIDACKSGEEIYILTADIMYQGTILTSMFAEGSYTDILNIPVDGTEKLAMFDGKEFSFFEPSQTVTEYRIKSVAYNDGVYVAAAGDKVLKSFDCENWIKVKSSEDGNICKVVFGDGKFLVCGGHNYYISKDNGITWIEGTTEGFMQYAAYGDGRFIITSDTDKTLQIDSETLECIVLELSEPMGDVGFFEGKFVAVKNSSSERECFILEEDDTWHNVYVSDFPVITKEKKTLRVCNDRLFVGVNDTTIEVTCFNDQYWADDMELSEYLVDSCEVGENEYILTSSTLYENGVSVQTVPEGRVFTCCTAGKKYTSSLTRSAFSDSNGVQTCSDSIVNSEENSNFSFIPYVEPIEYNKECTAIYTVITDTHGRPWGTRNADFDLGDNTRTYEHREKGFLHMDPVEKTHAKMRLYGNHDVAELQYIKEQNGNLSDKKGLQIYEDKKHKMVFYGFDSCSSFRDYRIDLVDIAKMAKDIQTNRHHNWDIAVLTHIPLFESTIKMGKCWEEDVPDNTSVLKEVLYGFKTHSNKVSVGSESFDFSKSDGHVIGCFCGHIHNNVVCAEPYGDEFPGNIHMQAFITNGEDTYTTSDNNDSGLYQPEVNHIEIVFSKNPEKRTVNGYSYENPTETYIGSNENDKPDKSYNDTAYGGIKLTPTPKGYPKFHTDGTYLGYSNTSEKGVKYFDEPDYVSSKWNVNCTVYVDAKPLKVEGLRFCSSGRLRYYWKDGVEKEFDNYTNASVIFDYEGFHWHFMGGKYKHPKSCGKKFRSKSQSIPAFDEDGRYIGWSDEDSLYLTGSRRNNVEDEYGDITRSWRLNDGDGAFFRIGNSLNLHMVNHIYFDENGLLDHFKPRDYEIHTITEDGDTLDDMLFLYTFDGTSVIEWTFKGRKFDGLKNIYETSIKSKPFTNYSKNDKYSSSKDWMNFTEHAYYFKFEDGYLKKYAKPDPNAAMVKLTDEDIDYLYGWNCNKIVHFYNTKKEVLGNKSVYSKKVSKLYFSEESDGRYYINSDSLGTDYNYASINGYIFKQTKKNSGKWVMYNIYR